MEKNYSLLIQCLAGVAVSVTAASVVGIWQTLDSAQQRLARIEEQVKIISLDRYTATDAIKDSRIVDTKIAAFERRLEKLEAND